MEKTIKFRAHTNHKDFSALFQDFELGLYYQDPKIYKADGGGYHLVIRRMNEKGVLNPVYSKTEITMSYAIEIIKWYFENQFMIEVQIEMLAA